MNSLHRYLSLLSLCFTLVLCAFSQAPAQNSGDLTRFENALKQDGFDFSIGVVVPLNPAAEWCNYVPGIENALYANNEPYLTVLVPKSPQQPPTNPVFQLREDEAVVLIGVTPPPAKYFSYTPYIASRVYPKGRKTLLASLGDAVNNATLKTIKSPPFNAPVALIFTPDQGTDARVRAALQSAGYPEGIINTLVFPASMLNLGLEETADGLQIGLRSAIWEDPKAGEAYIKNAPRILHVFRVTPHTPANPNPFAVPHLRIRGTGQTTEMDLTKKLDELRQGIIQANNGLYATDLPPMPTAYEAYDYIQRGVDIWADSRDSFYLSAGWMPELGSNDKITLADDEFLMVYGPNHVATGKATYMNMNVYASETAKLSVGAVDDRRFVGTAGPYVPPGDPAADEMFVYKVSRKCGNSEPRCLQLSADNCPRLNLGPDTILGLFIRTYLEPSTKVAPAMPEMLYDHVIKFSPRQ